MRLQQQGYEALIVPSRGAVPIASAARTYGRTVLAPLVSKEDRLRLAKLQFDSPLQKALYLPYTADAGPIGVDGLSTASVRRYWTKVLAAISRQNWEDPHYRFHRFTRDHACAIGHHDPYERFVKSGRFVFIDTVLSGRAVAEIADAFAAEGLEEAHFILLLDDCGRTMKPEFARRIRQLEADGRATLIQVETLFTEDQGPAVSGVWSVVLPALMEVARAEVPAFADGSVGSGLYYHEVRAREDMTNLNTTIAISHLNTLMFAAVGVAADPDEIAEDLDFLGMSFSDELSMMAAIEGLPWTKTDVEILLSPYRDHMSRHDLFDQHSTAELARGRLLKGGPKASAVSVSSSHCLRLEMSKDEASKLVRAFKASLSTPYFRKEDPTEYD